MNNLDKIFKAYDIRGVYPKEIDEEIAYRVGRAGGRFLKAPDLIVGRDNRPSSEELSKSLIQGIGDEGLDVIDIGLATTPMFYFAAIKWKLRGGIMITASHNPLEYNGFKIIKNKAMPVGQDSGLKKIKQIIKKIKNHPKNKEGRIEKRSILYDYIDNILDFVHLGKIKPFKVVIDTGKGVASLAIPELLKYISGKFIHISSNFLNPQNAKEIYKRVLSEKADLGVVFDGDGDRILFIDENGQRVEPDLIGAVLVHYYFKNAGKILCTTVSSRNLKEEIKENNNSLVISKVGHAFMKKIMEEDDIVFGCEPSGHYYFEANNYIESPLVVLLKILELLSTTKMPLSELVKPFQNYYREEINIKKSKKSRPLSGSRPKSGEKTQEFFDWWFNVRASNTEPVIRLTIEARTKELLEQKKKEILKSIS